MSELTAGEIPNILKALGWTPRALDDNTWRCTQSTTAGKVRVVVRHAGTWLYMVVMPFLDPESVKPWGLGKYPPRFLGRILAVNHNLVLVKFALDDEGDITLRVELPTESLQRREVETSALLLLQTTEQYRGPIRDALLAAGDAATPPAPPPNRPTATPDDAFGQPTTEPTTVPPPEKAPDAADETERERRLRAVTLDEHSQSTDGEKAPNAVAEKPADAPAATPEAPAATPEASAETPAPKADDTPAS